MKTKTTMKRWVMAILLTILGGSMSACAMGNKTSWKEEVLLHDGQKLIVERSVERKGRHELGQRPPIGEQSLTFTLPGTHERVTWEDHYSEDLGQANFNPMLLEIAKGMAYVLVAPSGCLSYNKWGRPNPPYVVFKYDDKSWQRIPLQALPPEIKFPNLVISSPDDAAKNAKQGVLSAETIKQVNEGFRQPEYQTILREAIPNVWSGCPTLVRTGNGWKSRDWFEDQPSYEACLEFCNREKVGIETCPCNSIFKGEK